MPYIRLNDVNDSQLAPYRDLPKSNWTSLSGRFIVEGPLMVERLAASDFETESVVVDERRVGALPAAISRDIPVYVLAPSEIEKLIGFNFHRGILACGRRKPLTRGSDWTLDHATESIYVGCVDVQDPTNLGGILRNGAAFGVDGILLFGATADPFSRRVLRVSMGTAFKLRIARGDGVDALREFREQAGVELLATVLDPAAEPLESATRPRRAMLLIGNEGYGLDSKWTEACDRRVTLSMKHDTDSLNAAAASAVLLYHFTRVARVAGSDLAES